MNDILARIQDENTPKFNKNVTDGIAKDVLKGAPDYINEIIASTVKTMQNTGLEYHGWRKLTPKEEFNKMYVSKDKKTEYDIAKSAFYLIELRFVYRGKEIPRYIYLPYAERGNILKISDTNYHIIPVLSDTVISPSYRELFVRLLKDKLTFNRTYRNVIIDGERVPGQIIYSNIYRLSGRKIEDNLGQAFPNISLYILGEMGLSKALAKYANITDYIVTENEVTEEQKELYRVYSSMQVKPKGSKEFHYEPHNVKILIPKKDIQEDKLSFLDNFIVGIIYVLDIMPHIAGDLVNILNNHDVPNEKHFWKLNLGRIIFKNGYSVDKMMSEMTDHFNGLHNYMDSLIQEKLRDIDVVAETFFDLLAIILERYNMWLLNSKDHNSDISNRYIDILYYILYDIIYGINRMLFDINKKGSKRVLSEKEVQTIMNNSLSVKRIYSLIRS